MEKVEHLKIPLKSIIAATNNFDEKQNYLAKGGFGRVYKGELLWSGNLLTVAVKRLDRQHGQGDRQFYTEISMLSSYKHKNLASLVGFCDESGEKILVYVHESRGSLDGYIGKKDLTWVQRLQISIGAACGFHYLHDEVGEQYRVLHRDIKSANILLNEDWEAKVSDFGLSRIGPANMNISFLVTDACGTHGYVDPLYHETGVLTKESDIYSFGVVLFEILCGRLAFVRGFEDRRTFLAPLAKRSYEQKELDKIIDPDLRKQMKLNSLNTFAAIAYQCLELNRNQRPTMREILQELEKALTHQVSFEKGLDHQDHLNTRDMLLSRLKIPLEKILLATNNFDEKNFIGKGVSGSMYKGELSLITVAVKRLDPKSDQGYHEVLMERIMLSSYKHKNLVSLVGYCDEGKEKILVYVHESRGSLDHHISDTSLTWMQRLEICIGAARGLNYLHGEVGPQRRVLHGDIKTATILLNDKWEAKVSDFGLSKIGPSNLLHTFQGSAPRGTIGYLDPSYYRTGLMTKASDIYSFGVVLFEILCGRAAFVEGLVDREIFLSQLAKDKFEADKLDEIINPNLRKQMKLNSLVEFSNIAYECLRKNPSERPTMAQIVDKLENAFAFQASPKTSELARVGIWGTKSSGGPQNRWAFLLEKDHKLKMITIDHGDLIYSLMFTTESKGVFFSSNKVGGWNGGGDTVSEVMFEDDEEIIGIKGTVGVSSGNTIISSLSFVTNKMTHGPFGRATDSTPFFVPWDKGNFGGFYGLASYYIDGIGVYMKASCVEIARVGIWGTTSPGGPQNQWSFQLERNHHLKKITIDHGDFIHSLMFTTEYRGIEQTSDKAGGWNSGGDIISEVTFAWDEEINAISGVVFEGTNTIISSLSFVTNKKTHGPYGRATGTPFTIPWDNGTFAGFYGVAGYYIDGIGVYLKATI